MTDLLLLVIAIALLVIAIASVLMLRYQGLQWRAHLDLKVMSDGVRTTGILTCGSSRHVKVG